MKMAYLVGFIEVGIEVIWWILMVKMKFLSLRVNGIDTLVSAAGNPENYVNYAPIWDNETYNNSTVL